MELVLQIVGGAYAVVLVVVLAVSLFAILWVLRSIGGRLGQVAEALHRVETNTAPLGRHVGAINGGLTSVAEELGSTLAHMDQTDQHLATVAGTLGVEAEVAGGAPSGGDS